MVNHPTQQQLAPKGITELVAKVTGNSFLSTQETDEALNLFEAYECWTAYFKLLDRLISDPLKRQVGHYVRMARAYHHHLEDTGKTAEICATLVKDLKISYQRFQHEVIGKVLVADEFAAEAIILNAIVNQLQDKSDRVKCLERLCSIYEKKTHNDALLAQTYERLIEVDPKNIKALRYFKLVFTQSGDWEEVVLILKTLLTSVTYSQEMYRVALELAAVYLYQLDNPKEAITIVESQCADSPIDTSTVLFDAYQRTGNLEGCLRVLRQCFLSVEGDTSRGIIRFKMAQIYDTLGDQLQALDNYQRAFKLWPGLLDAAEGIIQIGVARKDWSLIQQYLELLSQSLNNEVLKSQIGQAQRRISDGLAHAPK
jgi:tetratricopeptide (TPR) repeat protein